MCSMVYAYAPPIPIVAHFEANLPPRFLTRSKPSISFPTLFQNPNFITNFTSHSSSTFTPPQLNQSSAIGALDEEIEATSFGLVGANDLLIVGPGVLGRLVAEKWREEHRECQIVGQTMTTDHHDELIKVGIDPTLKGTKGIHKFPYVIFCAPTSQTSDYPGDVSEAASLWNGEGSFLFTSSSAPYDCYDNGLCVEDTPTVQIGRSPKTDNLLKAEKVATESGGCVLRLAGLYKVDRGAHVYWLRKGTVEAHPDHILNLIHYEDAASLSVAILKKKLRGRIFLGCDNHPLSRQEVMDVVIRSGKFSKKFEGFTGTDGPLGKKLNNSKTREEIGWEPKYPSFSQFLGCSEPQSEKKQIMGIEKEILRAGTGPKPVAGKNVTVHCTGFGKNGDLSEKFWSTKDPGQKPFTFKIGQGSVIRGWDEGVMGMQVGEVARLTCSPEYGYGASGFPAWGIQPNSVLVFEIEVLKVGDWLW